MTRTELIAALEAAEGPSRELDALIWADRNNRDVHWENNRALSKRREAPFDECVLGEYVEWSKGEASFDCACHKPPIPYYTESIDAALSFTPEGMDWRVQSHRGVKGQPVIGWALINGTASAAATPAIALCIANLRVLEAQEEA